MTEKTHDTQKTFTTSRAVTPEREYKGDGLPKTERYSVDKKPKINPRVSSPAETKEEREPGANNRPV